MTDANQKRTFIIAAILLLLPLLFLFIPNHTFTKKLQSEDKIVSNFLETKYDGLPTKKGNPVLAGLDGPYIFRHKKNIEVVQVVETSEGYEVNKEKLKNTNQHTFTCYVNNKEADQFTFQLRTDYKIPAYEYPTAEKLLAISDFEGNFDAFYSLLIANKVMDKAYNWTYGKGHLVIAGDMMDRGVNVTQCLWLIYKLEQAAEKVGGQVHFILGNHEVMNLHGVIDYVKPKYLALAMELMNDKNPRSAYISLMSRNQELVRWMKSKNIIEKIGDILFVHGGISDELVSSKLNLLKINETARKLYAKNYALAPIKDKNIRLINGRMGPLWYRGMAVKHGQHYDKASPETIQNVLKKYDANHVVIGHTPMRQMQVDYNGGVVKINLLQPRAKFTGKAIALLVENGVFYSVNDFGERVVIYQPDGEISD